MAESVFENKGDKNATFKSKSDVLGVPFYKCGDFYEDKERIKFIKHVERALRTSPEYRAFISYIREELQFNNCSYLNNLTSIDVSIEIHHHPFTLFNLVEIIVEKYIREGELFNTFMIAHDVMELHYGNRVGLIPLSKTIHELVHSDSENKPYIRPELVIGNYMSFFKEYDKYIVQDLKDKFTNWLNGANKGDDKTNLSIINELMDEKKYHSQVSKTKIYKSDNILEDRRDENG